MKACNLYECLILNQNKICTCWDEVKRIVRKKFYNGFVIFSGLYPRGRYQFVIVSASSASALNDFRIHEGLDKKTAAHLATLAELCRTSQNIPIKKWLTTQFAFQGVANSNENYAAF